MTRVKCTGCRGTGKGNESKKPCEPCKGSGWLSTFDPRSRQRKEDDKHSKALPYDWNF